jgi:hypothetical protein
MVDSGTVVGRQTWFKKKRAGAHAPARLRSTGRFAPLPDEIEHESHGLSTFRSVVSSRAASGSFRGAPQAARHRAHPVPEGPSEDFPC